MADLDDLFAGFEDPVGFDEGEAANPVVVAADDNDVEASSKGEKRTLSDTSEDADSKRARTEDSTVTESILDDIRLDEIESRIKVHVIESPASCTHEVAVYPGQPYVPLTPSTNAPAKEYKFILDPFQREAIMCIENNQSVLVSAHTSAGKTVVAEYAIAQALQNKQRVIYTTPIKALSNQKYREFNEEFKDVGLVTGDATINPSASCLIMTTEILRNMLYRGSEVMREVGWVVFDEIHYMRDKERGVVWEETLILLPDNVHYVFLSATIPNARQFCEWVCSIHKQPCHVVYTDYRPTALQHYVYPAGGKGIHLVVDEKCQFREDNFNQAMDVLATAGDAAKGDQQNRGLKGGAKATNSGETNIFKIVQMIMEQNLAPAIIFSFSKKECETYATQMTKLDFNSIQEKKLVDEVFNNAMDVLSEEDRKLPQVENVLPLLRRGIGIHHGGLLPILKEVIEILFGEGLIKALFATETFAMGLNMPARTVVFTSSQKYDGKEMRNITSGEYIQMSGRAGRRGIDDRGIVILMVDSKVSKAVAKEILMGKPDPINSAFHLTYNMVLNLLRVEEINPEYMMERSFFQFQNQSSIPDLYRRVEVTQKEVDNFKIPQESSIASYYHIRDQLTKLNADYRGFITTPLYLCPFLQTGRLVKIKLIDGEEFEWGVVLKYSKQDKNKDKNPLKVENTTIVDILLHIDDEIYAKTKEAKPCPANKEGTVEVIPVSHKLISMISSLRIYCPDDLRPASNRRSVLKSIREVKKRFPSGVPRLDPIKDMGIKSEDFKKITDTIGKFETQLYGHPLHDSPELSDLYSQYTQKMEIQNRLKTDKDALRKAKSLLQMEELKHRKRVLRRLGYCTMADVIEFKGRVACELSSADELLATEMIFNGMFNTLTIEQSVALLSCFVCDERSGDASKMAGEMTGFLHQMQDLARRIAKVSIECKLELDEENYVEGFKPFLMDVVHAWCKGASFKTLCSMTTIFEGSIIRCMRRLEELLRQMCQAAKTIGNTELENKFSEGIRLMKRDIVFAASLYL